MPSFWDSLGFFRPPPNLPVPVHGHGPEHPGGRLRILSWNLQFSAGRRGWFFYDGGPDSQVAPAEVERTLDGISALVRTHDPDLVLLQEVDRHSTRTAYIDQHAELFRRLDLPVHTSTPYFRVPFVPVPFHDPLGRVDMHLSVFSRFALDDAKRIALSPLQEPRYRRAFNLRRCLLTLHMKGVTDLHLFHTHLSAFSRQDGTLRRQVGTLIDQASLRRGPLFLAGDFNSLPPGDVPNRLGAAGCLYDEPTPIQPLYGAFASALPPDGPGTYVPWGSMRADRMIDYAFTRDVVVEHAQVDPDGAFWSDHLPLIVDLSV